jgi:WD40 repeat protein
MYLTSRSEGVLRCDWRKDKIESRDWTASKEFQHLDLSADGRVLAANGPKLHRIFTWNARTGQRLRSFDDDSDSTRITLSPDGKNLLRRIGLPSPAGEERSPKSYQWVVESVDDPALPRRELPNRTAWFFSPASRYGVSLDGPKAAAPGWPEETTLCVHDATKSWREVAFHKEMGLRDMLAFSANGRWLILTEKAPNDHIGGFIGVPPRHVPMTLMSSPKLEVLGRWTLVCPISRTLHDLALSPDGRTLALATSEADGPALFDARTGRTVGPEPYPGSPRDVFFLPDGKTIRTLDSENRVSLWDTATMRPGERIELGRSLEVLSARRPDGKYLLCQDYRFNREEPLLCVVDADTGGVVCTFPEIEGVKDLFLWGLNHNPVLWLNDSQLLFWNGNCLLRLDYRRGLVLKQSPTFREIGSLGGWVADWQPEQLHLAMLTQEPQGAFTRLRIDADIGKVKNKTPVRLLCQPEGAGSVPGDRYFYLNDPHFHLIDRQTLQVVCERRKAGPSKPSFSADGSRFAVLEQWFNFDNMTHLSKIRVHDTRTGRMLAVFTPLGLCQGVYLSPDGNRVVAREDDRMETWDLSDLARY